MIPYNPSSHESLDHVGEEKEVKYLNQANSLHRITEYLKLEGTMRFIGDLKACVPQCQDFSNLICHKLKISTKGTFGLLLRRVHVWLARCFVLNLELRCALIWKVFQNLPVWLVSYLPSLLCLLCFPAHSFLGQYSLKITSVN